MMLHSVWILAGSVPNVRPDTNNPLSPFLNKLLSVFLGALIIATMAIFFLGFYKAVSSLRNHHDGGTGVGAGMMIGSLILLGFLIVGTSALNPFVNFFSS